MRRVLAASIAIAAPFLIAAADQALDVAPCPRVPGGSVAGVSAGAPDLLEATGEVVELGTSARFTLRFADPLVVPDGEGRPLRVDIVLRDPDVPIVDAGLYRDLNRMLRYDAVRDPTTTILLLPEAGQSRFNPPVVEGETLVMQVPGRTLTADEDETGTSPGLDRLRWSVIVRDEDACDLLGDGRPVHRLAAIADDAGPVTDVPASDAGLGGSERAIAGAGLAIAIVVAIAGYVALRRARNAR